MRNWFVFSASERWREDDTEHEHYSDSAGKSGGQKEKLAYTILAASRWPTSSGWSGDEVRSRSFRFVVIDEAFGRGSDDSTRYGLQLFTELGLQLLVVTPLQKIHVIEPFVRGVGFVHNDGGRAAHRLRNLTIEQYSRQGSSPRRSGTDRDAMTPPGASADSPERAWTRAADVRAAVKHKWRQGHLLRSLVESEPAFPLRIALKRPSTRELGEMFADVRAWHEELRSIRHARIEYRTVNHRQVGANDVPFAVWIDTIEDAATIVSGAGTELASFRHLVDETADRAPAVLSVLGAVPFECIGAAADWSRLLDVADWLRTHPRPGIYLRQMDIPGVDTKLVERHRRLMIRILDALLADTAIDGDTGDLSRRYGFRSKPRLVRFRSLDPAARLGPVALHDVTLPAAELAAVEPPSIVFITENEINFLAFPEIGDGFVVFGAGSGLEHLAAVPWLHDRPVWYWGDIDTHGLAILDQLRRVVPSARSLLMDLPTLLAHRDYWAVEPSPVGRDLPLLNDDEREVYEALRSGRFGNRVRLEQERIAFSAVETAVQQAIDAR